jgi:hypothetical protein
VYTPATAFFATEILVFLPQQQLLGLQSSESCDGDYSICFCNVRVTVKHNCFVPNIIFKFFANSLVPV